MCKRLVYLMCFVLVLGSINNTLAVDKQWDNEGNDRLWRTANNWDPDGVPTSDDKVCPRYGAEIDGPIIDSATDAVAHLVVIGDWWCGAEETLDMTGGTLTVGEWMIMGYNPNGYGTFTLDDGTVNIGTNMVVGRAGKGYAYINGGTLNITGFLRVGELNGCLGRMTLAGGTVNTGSLDIAEYEEGADGVMDIAGGTLIIDGDQIAQINGYFDNGRIIAYGTRGWINAEVVDGNTVVTATQDLGIAWNPNPSTGAEDVLACTDLSWSPGDYAASHDVYFGTSYEAVRDANTSSPEYKGRQDANSYDCGLLELGKTYYWRIDEVNELPGPIVTGDLSIYYSFDSVGAVVEDESGNNNDGTVVGDVTAEANGRRGGAARFANSGYLDLDGPNVPSEDIPTSAITLAAWVKCQWTGGNHAIFNARASDGTWIIHPEIDHDPQYRFCLRGDGGVKICDIKIDDMVVWDEWVHYAGTYDKATGKAKLYVYQWSIGRRG